MKKTILSLFVLGLIFTGCKYEEGPNLTLATKKSRVANVWEIEKATESDNDVTEDYDNFTLKLDEDGDAELEAKYSYGPFSYEGETQGTWTFRESKENIELDFEDDDADREYLILRLTEDEMWLKEKGDDIELHLRTK